jgi:CIC family chloride channel protein
LVAGLGAVAFSALVDWANSFMLSGVAHYNAPAAGGEINFGWESTGPLRQWAIVLLPALGGLLAGLLVFTVAPEAEGHGTDSVINSFHNHQGRIPGKVPIVKMIASALTIGSGGSAGREGPITQIGAGFASVLGRWLKLPPAEVRLLVVIGCGAGIGATFRAPMGAALFAASVLYRETDYEYSALMPGFLASVTAYSVFMLVSGAGYEPIFAIPGGLSFHISQLPQYLLLGLAMIPLSLLYIWAVYGLRDHFFRRLPLPRYLVPAVGGLMLGLLAWKFPAVLGVGYGWIQQAIDGRLTVSFMLGIALLKIAATAFTISSGGSGGVFAPSHVIGGLAGGAFGLFLQQLLGPAVVPHPQAFVLIGMAAFFAAAGKVPIASLVLVTEMTGSYKLLIPAMAAISVAYMFSGTRWSIFESQVLNRFASPAHRGSYVVNVLEAIPVQQVVRSDGQVATVRPETTLADLYGLLSSTRQSLFPVVGDSGRYVGSISLDLLSHVSQELAAAGLIIADDLMEPGACVGPKDNLNVALETLLRGGHDELPVVGPDKRFVGLICRRDVLSAYYTRLKELQTA